MTSPSDLETQPTIRFGVLRQIVDALEPLGPLSVEEVATALRIIELTGGRVPPAEALEQALRDTGTDLAINTGQVIKLGGGIFVPDVVVTEIEANGETIRQPAERIERRDGRVAFLLPFQPEED